MLGALLFTAGREFDTSQAVRMISSGQWAVDAQYEFESKNLIELAISNDNVSGRPSSAIDLVMALAKAGVQVRDDSWEHAPEKDSSAYVEVFVRAMGQGADPVRLAYACKALALLRPAKPVIERAEKIATLIRKAGGFHAPLQGLDLISWIALHDSSRSHAGCGNLRGNGDDQTTMRRIRQRVFGHNDINHDQMPALAATLLRFRVAAMEKLPSELHAAFGPIDPGVLVAALEGAKDVDGGLVPTIGVRFHSMVYDLCSMEGKYSQHFILPERLDMLKDVLCPAVHMAAMSTYFCPNLSWILMERPGLAPRLLADPISLERAAESLAVTSRRLDDRDLDKFQAAASAFYDCLRDCPGQYREGVCLEMEAGLERAPASREPEKGVQAFLRQMVEAVRMENTVAAAAGKAATAGPRL